MIEYQACDEFAETGRFYAILKVRGDRSGRIFYVLCKFKVYY